MEDVMFDRGTVEYIEGKPDSMNPLPRRELRKAAAPPVAAKPARVRAVGWFARLLHVRVSKGDAR